MRAVVGEAVKVRVNVPAQDRMARKKARAAMSTSAGAICRHRGLHMTPGGRCSYGAVTP